jgi:hypothetical protein
MKKLVFIRGGGLRRVFINKRVITILAGEMGFAPFTVDLDKLDEEKDKIKKMKLDEKTLNELAKLETETEIAWDIKKDFYNQGWRSLGRNDSNR